MTPKEIADKVKRHLGLEEEDGITIETLEELLGDEGIKAILEEVDKNDRI